MKRTTRAWLVAAATLLPFLLLALMVPPALNLTGGRRWLVLGVFLLFGVAAALMVLLYLRARAKAVPDAAKPDDEIDSVLLQARKRLAGARGGAKLGRLPVVLVLGPGGSTKTTAVVRSGLEPELLAGEVHRDDVVTPTRVNVWFAEDAVFVEAGGKLLREPARWSRLIHHLRPSRLAAILPGGKQAPRMAVVCFACDELLKPGAAESATAAAQSLRTQLVDVAARCGIRLPVYVLFTKADRLPSFSDYVRSFTREETSAVLGATLPVSPRGEAGSWAEREAARVGAALEGIIRSLALRRLDVLPRENAEEVRAGAYEFPRELRKVAPLVTQFLVDLCRPSQLSVSPFLRGFYFTGVRAVFTDDAPAASAPVAAAARAVEATSVFDPRALVAHAKAAAAAPGGRKVPEWVFLRRVLGQLVLRDRVAQALTAGGTRVNLLRRVLAGGAAAALALLCIGLLASWRNNGGTIGAAASAAAAAEGLESTTPSVEELERLDTLRAQVARLRGWERDGAPLLHRIGLYRGDDVLDRLRPLYFARFDRMLWSGARGSLLASLAGLPAEPNQASEYGATYDALKAYLITTSHPRESTPEFLTPALMTHWRRGREVDDARGALAERQFAFFASELPFGNPYDGTPDDALVGRTRAFLRAFGNVDQFYQALIGEASKVAQPVRFAGADPVTNAVVVPGAFTKEGWTFVQSNLQNVDRLFARESWVLADATVPEGDRAQIAADLRRRYAEDYVRHWQEYLAGSRMAGFGGAQDAAAKLRLLSGPQSPLLRLFALASQNTDMDSVTLARAFQPVHAVVPPGVTDRLIVQENQPYMQGLVGLQAAMDQVAGAQGPAREGAIGNASSAADQIKIQVQQMAQGFNSEGGAQAVGAAVERMLVAPVRNVEGLLTALPSADANAQGQSFCARFAPVMRKYPFDARSTTDAQVEEVSALFQPGSSVLWSFYEENLRQLLVPEGEGYGPALGAALRPTPEFRTFFNRAAAVTRALYSADGSGPEVAFELRPEPSAEVPEIRVEIDGQSQLVNTTSRASRTFIWQAANARSARITATAGGAQVTVASAQGPWAVFRMFQQADPNWESVGPGHYRLRWRLPAQNAVLAAELRFDKRIPIFRPDYFDRLDCVSRIVTR